MSTTKKLSDLVTVISGGTPKRTNTHFWNGEIPWISIKDFHQGKHIFRTHETITNLGLESSSTNLLQSNDIIISARGTVGLISMIVKPMAFNQSIFGLRVGNEITSEYLYYWLKSNFKYIKNNVHGSVFDTITRDTFDVMEMTYPSITEQKKATHLLELLDAHIESLQMINDNLYSIMSIYWKSFEKKRLVKLSDLMIIKSGKRPSNKVPIQDDVHIVPIVGASKIMGYTTKSLVSESIITTGRVGTHGIIQRHREPVWVSDNSFIITSEIEESVFQILQEINYTSLNRGTTQPLITQKDLNNYTCFVPTNEKLQQFETNATIVTKMIFNNKSQIKQLTEIRNKLLAHLID